MAKKSFFRERTIFEIQDLHTSNVYQQRGLVKKIQDLNPSEDALAIRTVLTPGRFLIGAESQADANRKWLKHGEYLHIPYPKTRTASCSDPRIPLAFRAQALSSLEKMREEEIYFLGIFSRPSWGDRTIRDMYFAAPIEGTRIFGYAENLAGGIKVQSYHDAKRAKKEGASVVLTIPSRRKKLPRYRFKLLHVPIVRSEANLAAMQLLKPAALEGQEDIIGSTPFEDYLIRYTSEESQEGSEVIWYTPRIETGYLGIVTDQIAKHNLTPMEMNPFTLPSKKWAELYVKLCNNVLIFDPTLKNAKLRKPHLAEKSLILARAIGVLKHDETAYWDPARDGKLKDYNWQPTKS